MKTQLQKRILAPAPRWFRITNNVVKYTENFVILVLMYKGHKEDSFPLLAIKLGSSFVRSILRDMLTGNEVFAVQSSDDSK